MRTHLQRVLKESLVLVVVAFRTALITGTEEDANRNQCRNSIASVSVQQPKEDIVAAWYV